MNAGEQGRPVETGRVSAAMIDAAGWGVFFIWVGVAFLANVGWGVGLLGVGIIALAAQATRKYFALKWDRFGLVLGIVLAVAGVLRLLDIPTALVPILCIVVGVAFLVSIWLRRPRD